MAESVSIPDLIADSDRLYLASAAQLRAFCDELEKHQTYQILVGRRECDNTDQIEIFVTLPKKA
jgi:hypothetical protein